MSSMESVAMSRVLSTAAYSSFEEKCVGCGCSASKKVPAHRINRCTMPLWKRKARQRKTVYGCAIASVVLLVGLLIFAVTYLTLIVGEDQSDTVHDDCTSKATVVTDKALMQRWDFTSNFSQAWRDAEQNAREPAHKYMEKHYSIAIYMYTDIVLQPVNQDLARTRKQLKEAFESCPLYYSLSEAIQVLKHSQVTCLSTSYRTETLLNLSMSNKHIRFNTFILGSDEWDFTGNTSCFEVYTCFGADITHYSAFNNSHQVLIPPYEVFKVTDIQTDTQRCKVVYRLKSNLNCVYDRESNKLHSISSLPVEGFWLIFTIICIITVCLLIPFVIVKVLEYQEKTSIHCASSLHNSTYCPARVVI
ncbi:T-cell ecto-ADP-ribosyltransferase 1-like [Toxotes jaculatrix]|uniref:T-cell ecto-ADP-ribosyltransferase 1-like n=1 Tax=Toxotes jaculatrix TaxID=941984 RepID=UPI001B3A8118|nr:T-cell ecto-ADP-ribosyltransferase 1-like [Toxotes jaculatrix]